ncbi:MAG: pyridoxal-phosphate dependent enzyme, partial [Thermodesulfobacteriota bacterium]
LEKGGIDRVDTIIGCAGGGSNFAGLAFPFVHDKVNGADMEIIPVEPASCPTLTRTPYSYDFGDVARMTPMLPMHSLGHKYIPAPIHAGGLRYHGMAPLVSQAVEQKLMTPLAIPQLECYRAAMDFSRTEGMIVAPETSHAVAAAVRKAKEAKETGEEKVIVFNLSGHGLMDLNGYEKFLKGELADVEMPQAELDENYESSIKGNPVPEV